MAFMELHSLTLHDYVILVAVVHVAAFPVSSSKIATAPPLAL